MLHTYSQNISDPYSQNISDPIPEGIFSPFMWNVHATSQLRSDSFICTCKRCIYYYMQKFTFRSQNHTKSPKHLPGINFITLYLHELISHIHGTQLQHSVQDVINNCLKWTADYREVSQKLSFSLKVISFITKVYSSDQHLLVRCGGEKKKWILYFLLWLH